MQMTAAATVSQSHGQCRTYAVSRHRRLSALEHLELWPARAEGGGDSTAADLEPILSGARLPRLRHLALCNSEIQDEIAAAVATAYAKRSNPPASRLDLDQDCTLDVNGLRLPGKSCAPGESDICAGPDSY